MTALPPRHLLSKSTFVRGCQCSKSLWLYKNHFHLRDKPTTQQERIFMQGTDIGLLARQLFGQGVDASPKDVFHYREAIRDTAMYISRGHTVIFEAAFQYDGVMCAVDVLIKHKDKWYAYEVKSSTGIKPSLVQDAALQYYVITNAGLQLQDFFMVHINSGYVRCGDLQLKQLFVRHSVLQQVMDMQPWIAEKALEYKLTVNQKSMPAIKMGAQCIKPYLCDYYNFCNADMKTPENLQEQGDLSVHTVVNHKMNPLAYPFHAIDLSTFKTAVPEYDGYWPYRNIPFMLSVQSVMSQGNIEDPAVFLADLHGDPCIPMVKQLMAVAANTTGRVLVHNQAFTIARIKELISDYADTAALFASLIDRLTEVEVNAMDITAGLINNAEDGAAAWYNLRYDNSAGISVKKALRHYAVNRTIGLIQNSSF